MNASTRNRTISVKALTTGLYGSLISGRYLIVKLLGQGGMAHVYLAIDQETGNNVAVKVLHEELANDEAFFKNIEAEAKFASRLSHANIVRVISHGQDRDRRYLIQEYVEGSSLMELIDAEGAIPWQTAVPFAIQIGLALEHAHANGIVHRDIKPHNILISKDRTAKVTDFGIAQATTTSMATLTSGISFGSIHYSSPEQARGAFTDEKTDIYSLGIVMYEMVTGRVPFNGDTSVAIAIKHLHEVPALPSLINHTVPRGLGQIIMKSIQKSPANRYQNARELLNELNAFMSNSTGNDGIVYDLSGRDGHTTALRTSRPNPNCSNVRDIEPILNGQGRLRYHDTAVFSGLAWSLPFM